MRRLAALSLLVGLFVTGCNRGPTVVVLPNGTPVATETTVANAPNLPPIPAPELSVQERYDAGLFTAVNLLAEHKYSEALTALEQAQRVQDTEQVRGEIARVKLRWDAARAADRTARDIQTVLDGGKADEAARLATAALREYGDSESAEAIARLKRQADALLTVQLDATTRTARFRQEGQEAVRANNLRGAVLAYESAVAGGDQNAKIALASLQAKLTRYDDGRRKAAECRRDPARLDEALAALKDAAAVWDTPEVRQEINECTLALQSRRERIGVADFETRGEVGAPQFGRTVAEELLPAFKARFDLVERGQVAKVCEDLKLQGADLVDHDAGRRELARLAGVRYLVVGSVTRLGGVAAHARLLDLTTGLVVQTAKVSAATPETLVPLLPQLAAMLQMSDDQRLAYERQLAQQAAAIPVASEIVNVPPPPVAYAPGTPSPPPVVISTMRPPEFGGVVIEDFGRLPPPPAPGAAVAVQLDLTKDHKVKARALSVAVELGDDLFRRGRYKEAQTQFQVALNLSPGHRDIQLRLEKCQPLVATPVVVAQPVIVVRPRVAVIDFVAAGDPALVPPGLGTWAAENTAPYLCPPYDTVDRGEIYWYMGRLGVTLRDLVVDPLARLYLGRALNARFMVLGTLQGSPAGLNVMGYLLDTEAGPEMNRGGILARDRAELKCRLGELARWLLLSQDERLRREAEAAQAQALIVQAEAAARQSNFSLAIELTKQAGHKTPGVRVEVLLNQYDRQARDAAFQAERRAAWERQQAEAAVAIRRQQELAAAAEAARVVAAAHAAAVTEAERVRQRERACEQLLAQARSANQAANFTVAVQFYDTALAINRRDDVARELAVARAKAEEQARTRAAQETAAREAALRQQREVELGRVQTQLTAERQQRAAEDQARRLAQEQSDARRRAAADVRRTADATAAAEAEARRLAEAQAKAEAEARLHAEAAAKARADAEARRRVEADAKSRADAEARRVAEIKANADADARLRAEAEAKARADAEAKRLADARAKADAEARLKAEADAKARADADAKARADAEAKRLADARLKAEADAKARADGQAKLAAEQAARDAEARRRQQEEQQRRDNYARVMGQGKAALAARRFDEAQRAFADALKVQPNDPEAARLLHQAQDAAKPPVLPPPPARAAVPPSPPPAATPAAPRASPQPPAAFTQQMQAGAAHEKQDKYADASKAYQAALRVVPNEPTAAKRADYAQHMDAGLAALRGGKKPDAAREFEAALKAAPNDPAATRWLQQSRR